MTDLLTLNWADLEPVEDGDENVLLEGAAGAIAALIPDYDPADELALPEPLVEGLLKKVFDEALHPRWPKGTPKAGEFMKKGQVFEADGKKWQIVNAVRGHIEAVEASGKASNVEHRVFNAKSSAISGVGVAIPGVKPAKLNFGADVKAGKGDSGSVSVDISSPIVSPYVEPATHDPSIDKHPESPLSAEQWKRFGKEDQLYYNEVMERFGKWSPAKGKSLFKKLYSEYDQAAIQGIKDALSSTIGEYSNSGQKKRLNLAALMAANGWEGKGGYENAKVVFDELIEAIHWDLYNRTKSPDITLFHGGGRTVEQVSQAHLTGQYPIFSGFSQSPHLHKASNWGSTILATPTAIRYIALSHFQGLALGSEQEIAVGVRMKLDDRSVVFNSSSFGVSGQAAKAALHKFMHSSDHDTKSGEMVEELKAVWAGTGSIPIPDEPPGIAVVNMGNAQYDKLNAKQEKAAAVAHTLKYKSEDGTKEAAIGKIDGMGLSPGDFIEGLKGTRYVIVADSGDTSSGLRYVKVEKNGQVNYDKSYHFSSSAGNDFYRLDGHIDVSPEKKKGFEAMTPEQYAQLALGEKKLMTEFTAGEMLKVDGNGYKVIGPVAGSNKVKIESLDDGNEYTINALFKGVPLIPNEDFVPPKGHFEMAAFEPERGQLFIASTGDLVRYGQPVADDPELHSLYRLTDGNPVQMPLSEMTPLPTGQQPVLTPQKGDTFRHNGKKYTVSSTLKNGTVRAKPTGGKVEEFTHLEIVKGKPTIYELFRPDNYKLAVKVKAKQLEVGDLVSKSPAKIRPMRVVGKSDDGKTVSFMDMETGKITTSTHLKSWPVLIAKSDEPLPWEKDDPDGKPANPVTVPPPATVPDGYAKISELEAGDTFQAGSMEQPYFVVGHDEEGKVIVAPVAHPEAVAHLTAAESDQSVSKLKPKKVDVSSFEAGKYTDGDVMKIADMEEGQLFKSATGLPLMLKSKAPKGGATAVALHNGKLIKNLPYESKTYTTLVEKQGLPVVPDNPGEPIHDQAIHDMKVGDSFAVTAKVKADPENPGVKYEVVGFSQDGHPKIVVVGGKGPPTSATNKAHLYSIISGPSVGTATDAPGIPYSELAKGDQVLIKNLKAGDQYQAILADGTHGPLVQITQPAHGDQAPLAQTVGANGELLGSPAPSASGDTVAVYHGKPKPPEAAADAVDTSTLQHATIAPYGHHKSGTAKHSKLGHLAPGVVFTDKQGNVFAVKKGESGGEVVISDGSTNYVTEADQWVKPGDQVPGGLSLIDNAPALAVPGHMEAAKVSLTPNPQGQSIGAGSLGLGTGDKFSYGGKVYEITGPVSDGDLYATDVDAGGQTLFGALTVPDGYWLAPANEGELEAYYSQDLAVGDTFHFTPEPGIHAPDGYKVTEKEGGLIVAQNPETGAEWQGTVNAVPTVYGVEKASSPVPTASGVQEPTKSKPFPHQIDGFIAPGEVPDYGLVLIGDKLAYKNPNDGKFYRVGNKNPLPAAKVPESMVSLYPVLDLAKYTKGADVELDSLTPGEAFELHGDRFVVIGKGNSGMHVVSTDTKKVYFQSKGSGGVVTTLRPPPPEPVKVSISDQLKSELDALPDPFVEDAYPKGTPVSTPDGPGTVWKTGKDEDGETKVWVAPPDDQEYAGSYVFIPAEKAQPGKIDGNPEVVRPYAEIGSMDVDEEFWDEAGNKYTKTADGPTQGGVTVTDPDGEEIYLEQDTIGSTRPPTFAYDPVDVAPDDGTDADPLEVYAGGWPEDKEIPVGSTVYYTTPQGETKSGEMLPNDLSPTKDVAIAKEDGSSGFYAITKSQITGIVPPTGGGYKVGDPVIGPDGEKGEVSMIAGDSVTVHWDGNLSPGPSYSPAVLDGYKAEYMPKVGDTMNGGQVTDTNPDHPEGPVVEINGNNNWFNLASLKADPNFNAAAVGEQQAADQADQALEDYMRAGTWPPEVALPEPGEKVKYVDPDAGLSQGTVMAVVPDIDADEAQFEVMSDDGSGSHVVLENDLVRPVPPVTSDQWTHFNHLKVGDEVTLLDGTTATVTDNQIAGKGVEVNDGPAIYAEDVVPPSAGGAKDSDSAASMAAEFGGNPQEWYQDADKWGDVMEELANQVAFGPEESTVEPGDEDIVAVILQRLYDSQDQLDKSSWVGLMATGKQIGLSGKLAAAPEVKNDTLGVSPLETYKHPKSGSNKYDKIGTLAPATEFTDKKKGKYVVVAHVGQHTIFEDMATGKQYLTAKADRVKVTKAPLVEMAWRFTTAGTVKLVPA